MKKGLGLLAILALTAVLLLTACNRGTASGRGTATTDGVNQMTMTTSADTAEIRIMLAGEGTATIDWGDGTIVETDELTEFNWYTFEGADEYRHEYNDRAVRSITITGAVTMLSCSNAGLTALDVSKNPALLYLYCSGNQLTVLDVSRNSLNRLICAGNRLTVLDISRSTGLLSLNCSDNQLTVLDVSRNTALDFLDVSSNQLTALDLSRNTALHGVNITDNLFTAAALNTLFETLHDNPVMGEGMITQWIQFSGNPGMANSSPNIAEIKGWTIGGFTTETAEMPPQSFVGMWYANNVDFLEIRYIDEERNEIWFEWFIVNAMNNEGIARIDGDRITFVILYYYGEELNTTGRLEFNENGIVLTVEHSEEIPSIIGNTYHFTIKQESRNIVTPRQESYAGRWRNALSAQNATSFITIGDIYDTDIEFDWLIPGFGTVRAMAIPENRNWVFKVRDDSGHVDDYLYYPVSGKIFFYTHGILLKVDKSDNPHVHAGAVYRYNVQYE